MKRRPTPPRHRDVVPAELPCPDCGAPMVLKTSPKFGRFWGCKRYPACVGLHGAHQSTGAPMGTPADSATRNARALAHVHFDAIWQCGEMTRRAAYGWLRTVLFVPRERAHISMLTKAECERLIDACKARVGSRKECHD